MYRIIKSLKQANRINYSSTCKLAKISVINSMKPYSLK